MNGIKTVEKVRISSRANRLASKLLSACGSERTSAMKRVFAELLQEEFSKIRPVKIKKEKDLKMLHGKFRLRIPERPTNPALRNLAKWGPEGFADFQDKKGKVVKTLAFSGVGSFGEHLEDNFRKRLDEEWKP